jgi:DNA-binding phage protein
MATKSLDRCARFTNKVSGVSKDRTKELISAGLHRAVMNHGMDTVASAAECNRRTIENALSMNTLPEAHTLGNILRLEPTVLWEWLSELGFKVVPKDLSMSPDMKTATEMSDALTLFIRALEDGARDHTETVQLARKLRPLIPKLSALVAEADKHRVGERV